MQDRFELTSKHQISSAVEGIVFPAVPVPRSTTILALLYQLSSSQWWSSERIIEQQFRQLGSLIRHAVAKAPYYQRDPYTSVARISENTPADWSQLPILHREDVQRAGDEMLAKDMPSAHGQTEVTNTSGSTGQPVRVVRSQLSGLFWSAFTLRDHIWHARDLSKKLAGIRVSKPGRAPFPEGERAPQWGRASGNGIRTGPYVGLNILTPLEKQAEWLQRENPEYLITHPSNAWRLARYFIETGGSLPNLRQLMTISEAVPGGLAELSRAAWNVPVTDLYSSRETGYLALQCPVSEHYHIQSEGMFVEILDENDRACAPGQIGRVVVTPLHNFAMPLLRYDLGDYAELGEQCSCGRGLPVLTRIMGRRQAMLRHPEGSEIWSLMSSSNIGHLLEIAPLRRYQIAQILPDALELRVECAQPISPSQETALAEVVRQKFGGIFKVSVRQGASLDPGPGGKFSDVVCELPRES